MPRALLCAFVFASIAATPADAQKDGPNRGGPKPDRILSVCDVLRDLPALVGTLITVRGAFGWDFQHGFGGSLAEFGLDPYKSHCSHAPRSETSWPPWIKVESVDYRDPEERPVNFGEASPRYREVVDIIIAYGKRNRSEEFAVTFTGEIRSRSSLVIERSGDDIVGNGYGQAGAWPALLIVKTVVGAEDLRRRTKVTLVPR